MRVDPISLKLFLAVTELGTIAAAAEREHIAPSAVSKRISDLEDLLSATLLARTNKGIEATPAGVALRDLSRRIINDLDNVLVYMRDYASGTRGLVRIFANVSCIAQFLPGDLRDFVEKYPQIELQLEERISTATLRGVSENAADIGFYADLGVDTTGLVTLPYREDELMVIVPLGHPLSRRKSVAIPELLEHHLIGLETGSFINLQLLKAAGELGLRVKFRMQVNSYDAVCLMVEAGMGLGILPRLLAQRYSKVLGVKPILLREAWANRKLNICIRSYESLSVAAKLLVEHLQAIKKQ